MNQYLMLPLVPPLVPLICALTGCRLVNSGQDPSYTYESATLYDAAKLVQRDDMDQSQLLTLSKRFVDRECRKPGRRLARLSLSASRIDFGNAMNVSFPEADPAKIIRDGSFRLHFGSPVIAQVWCLGDQATSIVRRSNGIMLQQLAGEHDARELTLAGVKLTLVSVNLNPGWGSVSGRALDTIWFYARATRLPELSVAKLMHEQLEQNTGTNAFLVVRSDSFFVEYNGPVWDIFDESLPDGSAAGFLGKPHIVCAPRSAGGVCLWVTSPPRIPAEAWAAK
jgi:hypothetical protein